MYSTNPIRLIRNYWQNRPIIKRLVVREIYGRYRGTHLDFLWVVLDPVIMLSVYAFVFRVIFNRHWHSKEESTLDFAVILFAGLLVFNLFRETVSSAPKLILRNTNFVKKVVFPLEILSLVSVLSGLYHLFISTIILLVIYLIVYGQLHIEIIYTPIILLPYILILFGISLFLSSIGVYLRDVAQIVGMVVMATLFLSAIFYPIDSVPDRYQALFYLNPVAFTVDQFRGITIFGRTPQWIWLGFYYLVGLIVSWCGFYWFQKTRKGFADVL